MGSGKQIWSLEDLVNAVLQYRAVVSEKMPWLQKPKPAAIVLNMQGSVIYKLINDGLYIYEKEEKSADSKEAKCKENGTEENNTGKEV